MDFVTGLSRSQRGHDSIWSIVDRLTKSAYFLAVRKDLELEKYAELYVRQIVHLHGVLVTITLDRDPRFTANFWKSLQVALGMRYMRADKVHMWHRMVYCTNRPHIQINRDLT